MHPLRSLILVSLFSAAAFAGKYNMQWPRPAITTAPGVTVTFYAQTDQSSWNNVWIGYGTNPTDPSGWTWIGAWWHANTGLGKEVSNSFSIATAGTYYYASRWLQGATYYYGCTVEGQTDQTTLNAQYTWTITGGGGSGVSLADYSQITGIQYFSYTYDIVPEPSAPFICLLPLLLSRFLPRNRSYPSYKSN